MFSGSNPIDQFICALLVYPCLLLVQWARASRKISVNLISLDLKETSRWSVARSYTMYH